MNLDNSKYAKKNLGAYSAPQTPSCVLALALAFAFFKIWIHSMQG